MSDRVAPELKDGCYQWSNLGDGVQGDYAHLERPWLVVAHARGDFDSVKIMGTLFNDEDGETELARLMPGAQPLAPTWVPTTRVRPVVIGGTSTTVRLFAINPRG